MASRRVRIGGAGWRGLILAAAIVLAPHLVHAQQPVALYAPPPPIAAPAEPAPGERAVGEGNDVVLITFSGRCALSSCSPPDENEDALARELVPAVVAAWTAAGFDVEAWTYRGHVDDDPARGRGYLSASHDLEKAVQDGTLGPGSTARAVLLGYSHGTQWAHLLAFEHPEVPFAASVLLDSICLGWDEDHAARLVAALAPGIGAWPAEGPYHVGCDVLGVPAVLGRLDLGDVVPWNVARSVEVRSGGQVAGVVRDARRNVRPDGSRVGIDTLDFPDLRHQSSDEPRGEAFAAWLSWTIGALSAR